MSRSPVERVYALLVDADEDHGLGDLPDDVRAAVPGNATKQIGAMTLQKAGDAIVDAKTVLPWVLSTVGAPAGFAGLLVPIRESGSMLPQAALVPAVRRLAVRKWVWVIGGIAQAATVVGMALVVATATGVAAGVGILAALALFALARSLSSIASKDVLGRTIPKGQRGQINGMATVGAGLAAVTVGVAMRRFGGADTPPSSFAWLLLGAAGLWMLAVVAYASIREEPGDHDPQARASAIGHAVGLLRDDAPFRRFVIARTLLLVSALTPPFIVTLATHEGGGGLAGLGPFVVSSGLAAILGGRFWGRLADRSSRITMMWAAGTAAAIVVVFLLLLQVEAARRSLWLYPATYLLLALVHHGSRIGRKTYVVDLAEGNRRTDYVAVSNTAIGVLLLVAGAVTAALAGLGVVWSLLLLAGLGVGGVVVSARLPEVTAASP